MIGRKSKRKGRRRVVYSDGEETEDDTDTHHPPYPGFYAPFASPPGFAPPMYAYPAPLMYPPQMSAPPGGQPVTQSSPYASVGMEKSLNDYMFRYHNDASVNKYY